MPELCKSLRTDGKKCNAIAKGGSLFCPAHDPERQEDRIAAASLGGKAKHTAATEIASIKRALRDVQLALERGEVDHNRGRVIITALNSRMRAVHLESELITQQEIKRKLEAMQEMGEYVRVGHPNGGRR